MICERVVAEELDRSRLENLFLVGVDESSYRKHHNYLTLVTNHETGKIIYCCQQPIFDPLAATYF
ncbi:unnamed protein product [Acidithrix sp. C25]|nr:unnamed protein product [Acidithrix sp. C25]